MAPLLSVIIADVTGLPDIGKCLAAFEAEIAGGGIEVIVVEPAGSEAEEIIRRQYPWARLIPFEGRRVIPAMRTTGFECSRGEVIAILEDHEVAGKGWCQHALAAHRAYPEAAAIAGPIENGCTHRLVDWAAFFCEYCTYMPPVRQGLSEMIPGNNVVYKRWAMEVLRPDELKGDFWENTLHQELQRCGYPFRMEPVLCVSHQKSFGFIEYLRQRYLYSRYYAGTITRTHSPLLRLARSLACTVLPALLMKRILSCGFSKDRFHKELVYSVPLLLVFTIVWAIGEVAGSLLGPGDSLAQIE